MKKSEIVHHLRDDIKNFKHEANEDRALIKKLRKYPMKKCKHCGNKLHKEIKAGKKELKIKKVMREYKKGELHAGSKKGPVVTNPKQAIAISLSEARRAVRKKK